MEHVILFFGITHEFPGLVCVSTLPSDQGAKFLADNKLQKILYTHPFNPISSPTGLEEVHWYTSHQVTRLLKRAPTTRGRFPTPLQNPWLNYDKPKQRRKSRYAPKVPKGWEFL